MSTPNPFAKYAQPADNAGSNNQFAKYASADPAADAPPPQKRTLWSAINDTVIEGANAAAGTVSSMGNFVRPGNAASKWIDKNIVEAGEASQSDVVKSEKSNYAQEMQVAEGLGQEAAATLGYAARNPLIAAAQAAGSFATPGLAIKGANKVAQAAGLGTKATTRTGLAAGAAVGAAGAGGDAAGTAYDLSREGGATDEQAVAAARGASVIPAAIGAAGGLVGAERLLAGAKGFRGGLVSRALKTGAVEGVQEGIEEGVTQYEGQRAAMPFNPDIDPMKGVGGAATMGAVLGGATGAGASLLTRQHQSARKPSEELGLNPENGAISRIAATAVDEGRAAQPAQAIEPNDGLSLEPINESTSRQQGPSVQERYAVLPEQARRQVDQLLAEIDDSRTPEGVKRFRAAEIRQIFDANPMPAEPSMEIPAEERVAMRPIVRGYDPATGIAPQQPLSLSEQVGGDGAIDFYTDEQPTQSAYQDAINRIALDNYQTPGQPLAMEQASRLRDAAQEQGIPATIVPHPSGAGFDVQATAALPESARQQVAQDVTTAALSYDRSESGRMVADAQGNARPELRAEAVERDVRWNQERAQAAAEYQRRAELGMSNTVPITPLSEANGASTALETQGNQQPAVQPTPEQPIDPRFQASTGRGLVARAGIGIDQAPLDVQAAEVQERSIGMTPRLNGPNNQSITSRQGQRNGSPSISNDVPQATSMRATQDQAPAPALSQSAGVADGIETTQTQQAGAQPQAQRTAPSQSNGETEQEATSTATAVARKRTAGDNARARSYAANPMRAFLAKHGVKVDARSEFAPGLQEIRGTLVPGYGPIFRKNGKQLDELVQDAIDEGFLPQGASEADLYGLIDAAVRQGLRVAPVYTEGAAESEFEAMAARQAEFAREDYEADRATQEAEAAEYEAVLAQKYVGMTDEEFDALDAGVPILDTRSNMSTEDAMRALGFTEQEIRDAITQKQGIAPEGGRGTGRVVEADARSTSARDDTGQSNPRSEEGLSSYTAQEILADQEAQAKADADKAKADREADRRAQADRERPEFTLTGSDRAADANPNQGDIFAQSSNKVASNQSNTDSTKAPAAIKKDGVAARIDDVGEKIGGARKDVWTGFQDDLRAVADEQIHAQPLSKVWPQADYQKLIDSGAGADVVAMVRSLRDAVETKPRTSYKVKRWADQVAVLRGFATDLLDGRVNLQALKADLGKLSSRSLREVLGRAELYELVGHTKSLEGISFGVHHFSLYRGEKDVNKWVVERKSTSSSFGNWPRELVSADTKDQALDAFKKAHARLDEVKEKKAASFDIITERFTSGYFVGKKLGRNYAKLAGPFKTVKEARAHRDANEAELTKQLEVYKQVPQERADENRPRVGQDMRNGVDVTPEQFRDTFGFRGVEFGNWVEQGKRQQELNQAYDALMDMAAVLNLPAKAISLNGELGIAFGARGAGGIGAFKAHYESGKVVINLTKRTGAGSLGHEWWHAVDNYFSRMRSESAGYMTSSSDVAASARGGKVFQRGDGVRPEMVQAFGGVMRAINSTAMRTRSTKLDERRSKDYWGTDIELSARAYESYLISKLQDQNASNDYLVNVVDEKVWGVLASAGFNEDGAYPYATASEIASIRAGFDHFFQTVETKETDKGVAMFSRTDRPAATKQTAIQLRRAMVQRTVDALTKGWGQKPNIVVVDSLQDLRVPERVREADALMRSQGAAGDPEGFWYQGNVYMVANALPSSADTARVLYHEVLGHHGLRGKFGEKLDQVLDQVVKLRPKDIQAKIIEYGLDPNDESSVGIAAEEVLAEMAQTRPDIGFVQRAIAAIRNFLRSYVPGFKSLELTDADIVQGYLLPARGWVERGAGDGVSREAMDPAFSRDAQEGEEALRLLASAARSAGNQNTTLVLGPVMEETVFALQREGVPVEVGYRHTTDMYAVRHALSRHSDEKVEAKQGQLPLGDEDIAAIAQTITAPDAWILGAKTPRGQDIIGNLKRMPDGTVLYLEEVRSGRKALAMTSMRKYPGTTDFETIKNRIVPSYAHSDTGDVRIVYPDGASVKSGASSDSPRFSRSQPANSIRSSMGNMTADQERAYLAVAGFDKVPTLKERFDSFKANLGLRMKQALVDQFAPIAQLDQNAYMLARMSKGSDGTLEAALLYGRPFLRDGVPDVDVKDGGFAKVLSGLQGEHDRFLMHVAAQRAESLKAQGKENLFSDQDITSLKTLNEGLMTDGTSRKQAYAKALMQLNSFNESVLRMAKESGLIDQDAYDLMKDQPYVPFYRLMEEEGGLQGPSFSKGLTNQKAWKKLKGGTEQLNADLLQNMLLNWGNLYAASARNRAALATMDAADKMAVAYKVPSDTKGAAKVMRDGMTEHWMVEDPHLLEAISALNYQASPLMKPLAKAKQWLTIGVTVNPTFKVRNLIRDVVSSMAMGNLSYNPASNVSKGWKLTAKDSQTYASMLASGGVIKFGTQEQTDRARKQVAKLSGVVLDQNGAQKLWGQIKSLYAVYDEFGDRTENINRAALYDRLIAKGHSHADASFMARDLMDFSMGGSAPLVRFLTQSVPFLNARLQGLYKLGRAAKEDPRRFATVAMAVSLASLGLLAAYADDEDWKRREDWDRDSYWWFKIGETAFRIPKPFEVGAIGTLAERTAEAVFDDEMDSKRFMERISHMVSQTFAFDPVPQLVKPLLDIYANKDSFTGRAIESQADQRLRPEDRYSEKTSEVARFLGQLGLPDPAQLVKGEYTGLSPKQIDHLLRGYFSWMATASTIVSDAVLRHTVVDRGEAPDLRLKDMFLVGNFAESLPTGGSRYVTAMYEQARSIEQAYASYRDALASGDREGAVTLMEGEGDKIRNRASVATATKLLSQLNAQAKRIQADPNMDGAQKRERLTQLEQRRHEIAKRVMGAQAT